MDDQAEISPLRSVRNIWPAGSSGKTSSASSENAATIGPKSPDRTPSVEPLDVLLEQTQTRTP